MSDSLMVQITNKPEAVHALLACRRMGEREAGVVIHQLTSACAQHGCYRLVIDARGVEMLTSLGLGALVTISTRCQKSGGRMAIYGLREELARLVRLTRLERALNLAADESGAVQAVQTATA